MRLVALGLIGVGAPSLFTNAHRYWGQAAMVALVGAAWFAWVWFRSDAEAGRAPMARPSEAGRGWSNALVAIGPCVGVLVVMGLVGVHLRGIVIWGWLLYAPQALIAPALGLYIDSTMTENEWGAAFGLHYAAFAAVVALFFVAPHAELRERARAALTRGVPAAYAIQTLIGVLTLIATAATGTLTGRRAPVPLPVLTFLNVLLLALHIGFPAYLWHRWFRRTRRARSAPLRGSTRIANL